MRSAIKRRVWALACALSLLCCVPLVRPWLNMGTADDVSYTRSAQILEQTGHIVYNGWATAMLGWHLYWGALFIKLFGFSFNVTRLSTLPVAMATAFLAQRSMVRAGLTDWNATVATLTLVLSPLFLAVTFSYMTDVGGLLVIVLCFYACVRALQANSDQSACLWLIFAALSSAVGGSIRQIAWLGLLVMVPSTLWLLRKRRTVLVCGCIALVCGVGIVLGTTAWYKHQPGVMPESLWRGSLTKDRVRITVQSMARLLFDALFFMIPVLLPFVLGLNWKNRKSLLTFSTTCVAICVVLLIVQRQPAVWLDASLGNYGPSGINGQAPVVLTLVIRCALTVLAIASVAALAASSRNRIVRCHSTSETVLSWRSFLLLGVPFCAAYLGLMISRAGLHIVFDRYLLPLLFLFLIAVVRLYQERISLQLPLYAAIALAVVAVYSVGKTHDAFSMLRARLSAASELQGRGVPNDEIDGGWEFNTWTALNTSGSLSPYEGSESVADNPGLPCTPLFSRNIIGLHPKYALSYDPNSCGGPVGIPPVHYHEWFGPRDVAIYIVAEPQQSQN